MRGKAQTALARLGDEGEFNAILKELDSQYYYRYSIPKLRFIGGKRVPQALVGVLEADSVSVGQDSHGVPDQATVRKRRDDLIVATLTEIIAIPPGSLGAPKGKDEWIAWWAKNKDTAQIVKPPVRTYE